LSRPRFKGFGRRLEVRSEDVAYEYRQFVAPVAEGQVFLAFERFFSAARLEVEPGFRLVRKTFRLRH